MNGFGKDVEATTEAGVEPGDNEDEASLPAAEEGLDLAVEPGPLAAGRSAIARHVRHAPATPGVYRMIDARGDVLYVGKAKNIEEAHRRLCAADRA